MIRAACHHALRAAPAPPARARAPCLTRARTAMMWTVHRLWPGLQRKPCATSSAPQLASVRAAGETGLRGGHLAFNLRSPSNNPAPNSWHYADRRDCRPDYPGHPPDPVHLVHVLPGAADGHCCAGEVTFSRSVDEATTQRTLLPLSLYWLPGRPSPTRSPLSPLTIKLVLLCKFSPVPLHPCCCFTMLRQ